jgi:hypothetical protein
LCRGGDCWYVAHPSRTSGTVSHETQAAAREKKTRRKTAPTKPRPHTMIPFYPNGVDVVIDLWGASLPASSSPPPPRSPGQRAPPSLARKTGAESPSALRITLSLEGRGGDCICSASVTHGAGSGGRHNVKPMLVGAGIAWRRWGRAPARKRRHGGKLLWQSQAVGVASPLRTETTSSNAAPKVRASLCL